MTYKLCNTTSLIISGKKRKEKGNEMHEHQMKYKRDLNSKYPVLIITLSIYLKINNEQKCTLYFCSIAVQLIPSHSTNALILPKVHPKSSLKS